MALEPRSSCASFVGRRWQILVIHFITFCRFASTTTTSKVDGDAVAVDLLVELTCSNLYNMPSSLPPEHARTQPPVHVPSFFFLPPAHVVRHDEGKRRADERTEGKVECSVVELA